MATIIITRSAFRRLRYQHQFLQSLYAQPGHSIRQQSTAAAVQQPPEQYQDHQTPSTLAQPLSRPKPLTESQKAFLTHALRVNHAGELAAVLIYAAQTPPLVHAYPRLKALMAHMHAQEAGHLRTFKHLLARHRIRPTVMQPLWTVLATGMGWVTGLMGREASMACTEAVESVIGEHYNRQVEELVQWCEGEIESQGEQMGEEIRELLGTLRRIRDEELEHLDHAVEEDSRNAKPYEVLTGVIKAGCRGAIWVSERV